MNNVDGQYLTILKNLVQNGTYRKGRNGGTYGMFGAQMRFNLSEGFPLLTTKRVHFKAVVVELLWFLRGDTNVKYLHDHGVTIWDEWADKDGLLGPIYGIQWRSWDAGYSHIDQISILIKNLRSDPYSRRHVVTAWNPAYIDDMALPPCHCMFQFYVANGRLSCHLYQRSADWFLGVPFNIASYALLTHLIAQEVGLQVGDFIHSFGDLHLYANHVEQAREQLSRAPLQLPLLQLPAPRGLFKAESGRIGLFEIEPAEIGLAYYKPHPAISAPVSK